MPWRRTPVGLINYFMCARVQPNLRDMEKTIYVKDRILTLQKGFTLQCSGGCFKHCWLAKSMGPGFRPACCIQSIRNLVRADRAPSSCPVCDMTTLNSSLLDHVLGSQSSYEDSPETFINFF